MDHHQQASAPPPSCHLEVLNESQKSIQLVWVNFNGEDQVYQVLEPLASGHQDTFIGHTWKLVSESGELLLRYSGPSATFTVINTGGVDVQVK
mmetsp:Transcript_5648/g.15153  ORF Transcript_5648/g.15153 Transcript_5648/m.15153 type:complete len:93 (-) Transcript_5648:43-321(-)